MYVILTINLQDDTLVYYFDNTQGSILVNETYVKSFIGDIESTKAVIESADAVTDDGLLIRTTPAIIFTDDSISCIAINKEGTRATHLIVEIKEGYENRFDLIHKYVALSDESLKNIVSKIRTELRDCLIDKLI